MDYGRIIRRAVNIVWDYKFLIVLGILVALGSGTGGTNLSSQFSGGDFDISPQATPQPPGEFNLPEIAPEAAPIIGGLGALALLLVCGLLIVGLVVFVISTVARGGLIAGVDAIERGEKTSLSSAWSAGWSRVWTLVGIGILPAIPAFLLVLSVLFLGAGFYGFNQVFDGGPNVSVGAPFWTLVGLAACILLPLSLVLGLLRTFADRAAMLEGKGVLEAYGRGWNVLTRNLGSAIVLFLLQIAISVGLAILLIFPTILVALCCFLWPLGIIFQGAMEAFFSAIWTLAWREWTGDKIKPEVAPMA